MDWKNGFVKITVASTICHVGNPAKNVEEIIQVLDKTIDSDIVVFPELCITGYTCGDLFRQELLLKEATEAIMDIARYSNNRLIFVGTPVQVGGQLYNCAVVCHDKRVIGIIPKQNIPNYNEFYESRWFRGANGSEPKFIKYAYDNIPFGTDLLFRNEYDLVVHAEICEDLWMPIPPSSYASILGANVLVNLSASNEIVAKSDYRKDLVANQSARCVAAYAYASAGPTESTTDLVFGGHCLIAENGHIIQETQRVGDGSGLIRESKFASTDVDIQRLMTERRNMSSFGEARRLIPNKFREIPVKTVYSKFVFERKINGTPFIPKDGPTLKNRCAEVTGIQVAALAKRIETVPSKKSYIGVSGGLDSTLALLVAVNSYRELKLSTKNITGITMPGFGTTSKTKNNAIELMNRLDISQKTVDIRQMCFDSMIAMGHKPFGINLDGLTVHLFEEQLQNLSPEQLNNGDLVFENIQARTRTMVLMSHGFVLGTGDLSELALGWCTYNGDHMSMYNVNCSIPKTLVKFIVDYYADNRLSHEDDLKEGFIPDKDFSLKKILKDIVGTTISPELLPHSNDNISQSTEDNIGPYELHDFYLVNFVKNGFSPEKILFLSNHAEFTKVYSMELRVKTMKLFIKRFFGQQFKRSCVPDGPKVGSVSLSPRGDWRMPSDADALLWLCKIQGAEND